ncbi:hypothetical protein [Natrarchaeobius versutus]|uniref:hypothetical protein n=1 Tax=Natrarchaeobius versutus TaxID=1679078 RepID=UPI00350F9AFC
MNPDIGRRTILVVAGLALIPGCLNNEEPRGPNSPPRMTFAWDNHLNDPEIVTIRHEHGESVKAGELRFVGTIEEDGQTWADAAGLPADDTIEEGDEVDLTPLDSSMTIAIRWEGGPDGPVELSNRSINIE